jgi:hypothetical protein
MKCQARVLDKVYPFENVSPPFYSTKECGNSVKRRICDSNDDRYNCCSDCFRRYNTNVDWYGWFDGLYPPEARVVGSQAFYQCKAKVNTVVEAPKQINMSAISGDAKEVEVEPKVEVKDEVEVVDVKVVETLAPVAIAVIDDLSNSFAKLRIKIPSKKESMYPIETDLANLSLEELRELHTNLMRWMKGEGSKYPRLLVPYYKYRIRLEGLLINKK